MESVQDQEVTINFYRHMLSYMYFTFWNFRHRLARIYLVLVESKQADKEAGRWPTKWGGKNEVQNEIKTTSERDQTPPRQDTQPATAVLDKY